MHPSSDRRSLAGHIQPVLRSVAVMLLVAACSTPRADHPSPAGQVPSPTPTPSSASIAAQDAPPHDAGDPAPPQEKGAQDDGSAGHASVETQMWKARIAGWLQKGFRCAETIQVDQRAKMRVSAVVKIAPDLTVEGYTVEPGSHPEADAAVRRRLDGAVGQQVPPRPVGSPDIALRTLTIAFRC
jgi:hypothetical protein